MLHEFELKAARYDNFSSKMNILLKELVEQECISYHSIVSRVKEKNSLDKKIENKDKYENLNEVTDIVGCRIITYFEDDVEKIVDLIEKEFTIDKENSIDKKKILDPEKFGYLSYHIVCTINAQRGKLIEYQNYKEIKFEIQIRTILQHAWAEIEHDIGYKTEVQVPSDFRRKFSRLAGMLEMVDDEFTRLKHDIKGYVQNISEKGLDDTDINFESIKVLTEKSADMKEISKHVKTKLKLDDYNLFNTQNDALINWMLEIINKFTSFNKINELELAINTNKKVIKTFCVSWINANPEVYERLKSTGISYSILGIYYYILVSFLQVENKDKLIELFQQGSKDKEESEAIKEVELAQKIYTSIIKSN